MIGSLCLLLGMLGTFLLASGIVLIVVTIILSASGDDATGLDIIVGPMVAAPGFVLGSLLFQAIRLLGLRIRHVVILGLLISFIPILYGIQSASSVRAKNNAWREKLAKQEAFYRSMDPIIQKKLEVSPTVKLSFYFSFADDWETERKAGQVNVEMRKAINKEFVNKNVIEPMGADILHWNSSNTVEYFVEVNKAGYEKLKNNKHVKWITFWKE